MYNSNLVWTQGLRRAFMDTIPTKKEMNPDLKKPTQNTIGKFIVG
jgi:hypothetical protein